MSERVNEKSAKRGSRARVDTTGLFISMRSNMLERREERECV